MFRKLSANLYDIYHCCVYSEKLLMIERGTVRKNVEFYSKNKFDKLLHLVGFIIRIYHSARSPEHQNYKDNVGFQRNTLPYPDNKDAIYLCSCER